jgi:uncharacterized damage-inducible protein DinB
MTALTLETAVEQMAAAMIFMSDVDLSQPCAWGPHDEGVRFAILGSYQELQQLAIALRAEREAVGRRASRAQQILAQKNNVFRDVLAIMVAADDGCFDSEPQAGEWPLRRVLGHMIETELSFFSLVHYGVRRQRHELERPPELPEEEIERLWGPYADFAGLVENGDMGQVLSFYRRVHARALAEFADITDAELEGPSIWWEGIAFPVSHRLHRFAAHGIQHIAQLQKTLDAVGRPPTEAGRLVRRLFGALAEVEATLIGVPELGAAQRLELANTITGRTAEVTAVVQQARDVIEAVQAGDVERVQAYVAANPALVDAYNSENVSALMTAIYAGQPAVAEALLEAGAYVFTFEAAALGRLERVQQIVSSWPPARDLFARDGFTALQLACFFGREDVAHWLIQQGADVDAQARNRMLIRPIHATAANGNLRVLQALLERGADVNAVQEGGYTALHEAAHRGDESMARLLLSFGADRDARTHTGQTPADVALADGHPALAQELQEA